MSKGFVCADRKIAIISYEDIFRGHKIQTPRRVIKHSGNVPVYSISDLKKGDYVVHINHGIGIFQGLKRLDHDGVEKDYLILEYKDGDVLYVPIEQIDLIQKYIGLEKSRPSLHK
ncbi:transcription-repair coupling factor, partial [bacterium]|nr:transcription-repair coupling factor [bacterium]